jgi:hypothetical protein
MSEIPVGSRIENKGAVVNVAFIYLSLIARFITYTRNREQIEKPYISYIPTSTVEEAK